MEYIRSSGIRSMFEPCDFFLSRSWLAYSLRRLRRSCTGLHHHSIHVSLNWKRRPDCDLERVFFRILKPQLMERQDSSQIQMRAIYCVYCGTETALIRQCMPGHTTAEKCRVTRRIRKGQQKRKRTDLGRNKIRDQGNVCKIDATKNLVVCSA